MPPFGSMTRFLDLQFSKNDRDITSTIFENLITERFYITKYTNTSYTEVDDITPFERKVLIKLISEDINNRNKAHENAIKSIKEM